MSDKITDPILEQLVRRIEGDRQALNQAASLLYAMTDRKAWKHLSWEVPANLEELEKTLEARKITIREITLADGWWRRSTGTLIGFLQADDTPVLLRPHFTSYSYVHPGTGRTVRIDSAKADSLLRREAYTTCRPLPDHAFSARALVKHALHDLSAADAVYALAACVGVILLTMFTPYVSKLIFNEVIPSGDASQIVPVATLLASAAMGLVMVQLARNLVVTRIKDKVEYSIQTSLMQHLVMLPATFFKKFSPGDLSNRVLSVSRLSALLTSEVLSTTLTFLFTSIMFVQFFIYGGPLLYTGIAVLLLVLAAILLQYHFNMKIQDSVAPSTSRLSGTVYSLVGGIQKVKTCGAEFRAYRHWAFAYEPTDPYSSRIPQMAFYASAFALSFRMLPMIVTMYAAWHYGLGLSDYIAYCSVLGIATETMGQLQSITKVVAKLRPEAVLCRPIMEADIESPGASLSVKDISGDIDIRKLKFRYGPDMPYIFDNLNLHIHPGDYVALIGASGCGKSTLVRLMLGFDRPEAGSIFYDQYNLSEINKQSIRQHCMSVCLQDGRLIEGTILDNITFNGPLLTEEDAWEAARMAALDRDIEKMPLGMQTPISVDGQGVSGGQRQRILIARALVRKPRIIFLDEATSALDNISQHIVTENLAKLRSTRIVIAHRLSTIKHCNRIIVLRDGKVEADGNFEQLEALGYFSSDLDIVK